MEKTIKKRIPGSEYRYALMNYGYESYTVAAIQAIEDSHDFIITLKLKDGEKGI